MPKGRKKAPPETSGAIPSTSGAAPETSTTPKETLGQKLKRLSERRVPKAVAVIRQVGNLGGYKPSEAQVTAILRPIVDAVNDCRARLSGASKTGASFSLPE